MTSNITRMLDKLNDGFLPNAVAKSIKTDITLDPSKGKYQHVVMWDVLTEEGTRGATTTMYSDTEDMAGIGELLNICARRMQENIEKLTKEQ